MKRCTVGLTGGIGSGKSAVTAIFAGFGIDCCDADVAARSVVRSGTHALAKIAGYFGAAVIDGSGNLNRSLVRRLVFEDPAKRKWLEQLLHPLIATEIQQNLQQASSDYILLVSPLLIESGQWQMTDRILAIDILESQQLRRAVARDGDSAAGIRRIIASQASRSQRLAWADDVIDNNGSPQQLKAQVLALHRRYLRSAESQQRRQVQQRVPC